jgi:hypothetical protein
MSDVTVASFEEMEPIYEGLARRARATLGVTAFGMQVMNMPLADWVHRAADHARTPPAKTEPRSNQKGSATCR